MPYAVVSWEGEAGKIVVAVGDTPEEAALRAREAGLDTPPAALHRSLPFLSKTSIRGAEAFKVPVLLPCEPEIVEAFEIGGVDLGARSWGIDYGEVVLYPADGES